MSIKPSDILFYGAGASLAKYGTLSRRTTTISRRGEGVIETVARTGTGTIIARDGTIQFTAQNLPRINWRDSDDDGVLDTPSLVVENETENLVADSDDLTTGGWTAGGAVITAQVTTCGEIELSSVEDDSAGNTRITTDVVSFASSGTKACACIIGVDQANVPNETIVQLYDGTAVANRGSAEITWGADFSPTVVMSVGSQLGDVIPLANDLYLLRFNAPSVVHTNTNQLRIVAASDGVSDVGTIYIGGCHVTDMPQPGSIVQTSGGTGTRNDESCSFPFMPSPQEMTVYVKFIEGQDPNFDDADVCAISDTGLTTPYLRFRKLAAADSYRMTHGGLGLNSTLDLNPSGGDIVELRGVLGSDGGIQLHGALNDGTESSATASAAGSLSAAWSDTTLHIGGRSTSAVGFSEFEALIILRGIPTLNDIRALLP